MIVLSAVSRENSKSRCRRGCEEGVERWLDNQLAEEMEGQMWNQGNPWETFRTPPCCVFGHALHPPRNPWQDYRYTSTTTAHGYFSDEDEDELDVKHVSNCALVSRTFNQIVLPYKFRPLSSIIDSVSTITVNRLILLPRIPPLLSKSQNSARLSMPEMHLPFLLRRLYRSWILSIGAAKTVFRMISCQNRLEKS